jgi:GAF domain-containing protein
VDPIPPEHLAALDGSTSAYLGADAPQVLDRILHAAEQLAPRVHVGIAAADSAGAFTTLAGTDSLVFMLDEMQYDLDEGPGLTAMREGHTVIVDDAESEHRWPRFMPRAVDLGLRSHLAVPISVDGKTLGGLNMYSAAHACVDAAWLPHARLLAGQAALALRQTRRENDLVLALQSSRTIGKAIGLVMERFDLDDHEAFEYLATLSQNCNMKLRDIAAHLVTQSNALRHVTRARGSRHPQKAPGLTLVPALDATEPSTARSSRD